MYALKRIGAYAIDMALIYGIGLFLLPLLFAVFAQTGGSEEEMGAAASMISLMITPITYGAPILVFGIMEGALGWTPGKLILMLRVKHEGTGKKIGIGQGILRQVIKTIALSFLFLGALWALYGIITHKQAFYDEWLRIDVEDIQGLGLTETQRNWRKQMRS